MRGSSFSLRASPLALLALCACLAPEPEVSFESGAGTVRAASRTEAQRVAAHLVELRAAVLSRVPGAAIAPDLEVWMQDEPHLYHRVIEGRSDAEGLYAPGHDRILLSSGLADLERVLAHELVHAALGRDWRPLSGTLEEGLCDLVASELVPGQAHRLRAGRLSSAALACGGLRLGLEVRDTRPQGGARLGWSARINLTSEEPTPDGPLGMFHVRAGLSSTRVLPSVKRGYYGLAFLVAERLGVEGLRDLCQRAARGGHRRVPRAWVLRAAGLDEERDTWRRAAAQAMGEPELIELVRMYPNVVAGALCHHLRKLEGSPEERWAALEADLWLIEGGARVRISDLGFLRNEVLARLRQ